MGPIRSPSGESARHEDAQKRLISATAAAQKRRVGGLAYESPAALRGWRSGEQAGTCSAVLGAAGESRERGRGWPPRAAKAKYRPSSLQEEATRRSNGPGQPREAPPRKSRKPRNVGVGGRVVRPWWMADWRLLGRWSRQALHLTKKWPAPVMLHACAGHSARITGEPPTAGFAITPH